MAKLVIKDLEVDATLDTEAMRSIAGGSRSANFVNTPSAAKFARSALDESNIVRGLLRTKNLRSLCE